MLQEDTENSKAPEWLEKLESSRNRAPKLAHEVGSGSPCLKCLNDCKGLDLHFWRKICRNCKCTKDDHDVKDDGLDIHFNIVFGQKPFTYNQSKLKISLKTAGNDKIEKEVQLAWVPPSDSTKAAEIFVKSLPENRMPIVGSTGASHRVRQLKKQLPLHDFDSSYCHDLNNDEKNRLEEYSTHSRMNALGQGQVIIASSKPTAQPDVVRSRLQYGAIINNDSGDGLISTPITDDDFPPPPPELLTDDDNLPTELKKLDLENSNKVTPGKLNPNLFSTFSNLNLKGTPNKCLPGKSGDNNLSKFASSLHSTDDSTSGDSIKNSPISFLRKADGEGNAMTVESVSGATCNNCCKDINVDEVAVIIKSKQGLKYWHPNCFVCNTCQEFLVDLIYFMKEDKIYCGRDYAKECNIPRCFACDELIFSNEYTMAEMKTYHVRHFCCFECDQSLANQEYIVKMGNPVCLPCFQLKYAKMCSTCNKKIGAHESGIDVNNMSWHANSACFLCKYCNKSLLQTKFVLKNNFPFCSKDCYVNWTCQQPQQFV